MSALVTDFIAAEVAALKREVETPIAPFGYGSDLSCVDDITDTAAEVDPFSRLALAEAVARRLTTARGTVLDDLDYGLDLRRFLNAGVSTSELAGLAGQIRMEVQKDDRVDRCAATVTLPSATELSVKIVVTPIDPRLGTFTLTLAVTSSTVLMEAMAQ